MVSKLNRYPYTVKKNSKFQIGRKFPKYPKIPKKSSMFVLKDLTLLCFFLDSVSRGIQGV